MKTDRELLELAAKAAGLTTNHKWNAERLELSPPVLALVVHRDGELVTTGWNPLEDDGDALRLAVKLKIGFKYHLNAPPEMGLPRECAVAVTDFGKWFAEVDRDEEKATRRAIVRAAAAIGESM